MNSPGGLLSAFPSEAGELLEHSSMETVELPPMTDLAQFHCLRLMGCKRHGSLFSGGWGGDRLLYGWIFSWLKFIDQPWR